jgi:hypothetical protein
LNRSAASVTVPARSIGSGLTELREIQDLADEPKHLGHRLFHLSEIALLGLAERPDRRLVEHVEVGGDHGQGRPEVVHQHRREGGAQILHLLEEPAPFDRPAHADGDPHGGNGLGDVIDGPPAQGSLHRLQAFVAGRQNEHRDLSRTGIGFQALQDLEAGQPGHVEIEEDAIRSLLLGPREAGHAVRRLEHPILWAVEQILDERAVLFLVVDNQNRRPAGVGRRRLRPLTRRVRRIHASAPDVSRRGFAAMTSARWPARLA